MRRSVRYGAELLELQLADGVLLDEVGIAPTDPCPEPSAVIARALEEPCGIAPLYQEAKGCSSATVIVDDNTRPTPVHLIAPHVAAQLEMAGVASSGIRFLIASGTHRPMTAREIEEKLGHEITRRYRVDNHDYQDVGSLRSLGSTPSGVPVTANRIACDSEFIIGIGNIVPHRYCGWSGGAKIIQPGISGETTTAETHLMITRFPDIQLGTVENQVRWEMESVADQVGLRFIVNTILTNRQQLFDVVAGDFRQAFREGVRRAEAVYCCPIRARADIVIASAYPSDTNLWQAGKALYAADLMVRAGGTIILVSPCSEGVGEHDEFARLLKLDYDTVDRMVANGTVHDRIGAAAVLAVALVRKNASVYLVSHGIEDEEARVMGIELFSDVQHAYDRALRVHGGGATVSIAHEATEIYPKLNAG